MASLPTAAALAARSVHVKVYPTPRTLPERRQVLRVLERFGDIDMFRSLRYESTNPVQNAFSSIFSTPASASAAIAATPLRYSLVADHSPSSPSLRTSVEPPSQAPQPTIHEYELRISPSSYPHLTLIQSSPLHGPFKPVSETRSAIAADLLTRLPHTAGRAGLADWVTGSPAPGKGTGTRGLGIGFGELSDFGEERDGDGSEVRGGENGNGKEGRLKGIPIKHHAAGDSMPWRLRDKQRRANSEATERNLGIIRNVTGVPSQWPEATGNNEK